MSYKLLTEEKAAELSAARAQHEAVLKIVKSDLASKLNSFYILYYVVLLVVSVAIAVRIIRLPDNEGWKYLAFFFIANGIYFTFLMLLSLSYELYLRVGWHTSLAALVLVLLSPEIQKLLTVMRPLIAVVSMAGAMLLLLGIGFIKRTSAGRRIRPALKKIRSDNRRENKNREEFTREAIEFLSRNEPKVWLARQVARRLVLKSAAGIVYSIKESKECRNKREAIEEFVKLHRLGDALGRLALAVGVASALAYVIFPLAEIGDAVSFVALKVLPIYGTALFVTERFDEAREAAFRELQIAVGSVPEKGVGSN
jgi:hypothetical protein